MSLWIGLTACQQKISVDFTTAAGLVQKLMEDGDGRQLLNLQRQLSRPNLLIIQGLSFVSLPHVKLSLRK